MEMDELEEETPHVLMVEDDEGLTDLYTIWLEEFCTITAVHDCNTAYEMFGDSFDVVLLDRHLPDGTGDELLKEIRTLSINWPVALVTAEEPKISDLSMGFDEYINKPASKEEIQNTVARLMARTKFEDGLVEHSQSATKKKLMESTYESSELEIYKEYIILKNRLNEVKDKLVTNGDSFSGVEFSIEECASTVNSH